MKYMLYSHETEKNVIYKADILQVRLKIQAIKLQKQRVDNAKGPRIQGYTVKTR